MRHRKRRSAQGIDQHALGRSWTRTESPRRIDTAPRVQQRSGRGDDVEQRVAAQYSTLSTRPAIVLVVVPSVTMISSGRIATAARARERLLAHAGNCDVGPDSATRSPSPSATSSSSTLR
jgi:hypothetical protein